MIVRKRGQKVQVEWTMDIIWNTNDFLSLDKTVLTLGTFDGVHLGHQELIRNVVERAHASKLRALAVTFEPHPQLVLQKTDHDSLRMLTTIEEKIAQLQKCNLDTLVIVPFSPAFAAMSSEEFVKEVLIKKLRMAEMFTGRDHAFGKSRRGNLAVLQELAKHNKFSVTAVEPVQIDQQVVSSTRIRAFLNEGQTRKAAAMLGRPYSLQGRVIKGDGRGKNLGFPTINLQLYSQYKLTPKTGIYASTFLHAGRRYPSVTYIGMRPTFDLHERVIETHVMNFDHEIYGHEVNVALMDYLREDIKFPDQQLLIEQIKQDVSKSLELLQV